jgi:uncharacterized integral membrane protein
MAQREIRNRRGGNLSASSRPNKKETHVALVLLILLLILILGGVGLAAAKLLLWIALILLVLWIIGFFVRGAEGARWYRW